jgi:hypothetical protein
MKRKNIFISLFLSLAFAGMCQNSPMFETKIWVRDAVGHWDSIEIGYDLNDILLDTAQFHEIIDNSPFDSVFEVRVEQREWGPVYEIPYYGSDTYKRFITSAETAVNAPWCTLGGSCILYIQAKYQPITLFWDRSAFDAEHCRDNAFFTPDRFALVSDPPSAWIESDSPIFACASKADSFTCYLPRQIVWTEPGFYLPYVSIREVEGVGLDTIIGLSLEFSFGSYFSPCRLVVENKEPDDAKHSFDLFPNPVKSGVKILTEGTSKIKTVTLSNSIGLVLKQLEMKATEDDSVFFEMQDISVGLYYLSLCWENGSVTTRKVVKI